LSLTVTRQALYSLSHTSRPYNIFKMAWDVALLSVCMGEAMDFTSSTKKKKKILRCLFVSKCKRMGV
jgi:hypothetical protein